MDYEKMYKQKLEELRGLLEITKEDNTTYSFVPKKDILAWLKSLKKRIMTEEL